MAKQRGQSTVETGMILVLMLLLLFGVYAVSTQASDLNIAGTASRSGARFAAELGNGKYQSNYTAAQTIASTQTIDRDIVKEVCKVATQMPYLIINASNTLEVDVYQPTSADGVYNPVTDKADQYYYTSKDCTAQTPLTVNVPAVLGPPRPVSGSDPAPYGSAYTVNYRSQLHPNESLVGIRLVYTYNPPTPLIKFSVRHTVYNVVTLAPLFQ